ncbi:hypothetical protein Bhyg_09162 [Pseudolycoriella hygida]|uniref:Uncharacterized protein n=1 Tax=Pseudolycoriella hygida TaxID=35572 RepID=A0A9Q0N698_9DIPT|nr:hypothetical protein Bhyg_09162 [Pseudolycoriella hygida]
MKTVTVLVAFCIPLIASVGCNAFKKILSERVHTYLRDQYKDNPTKCECMIEYFRLINIWEKFYSEDIVGQRRELVRDLRPYIEDADSKCTVVAFYDSSWGICVTVLAVVMAALVALFALNPTRRGRKKTNINKTVLPASVYMKRSKYRKPKPLFYYQLTNP